MVEYNKDNPLRVITLFSGYDSQCLSLERLKANYPSFSYELVAWCEIEDAAIQAHNALFPQWKERNIGDITKVQPDSLPDCDLITWSFPCTDISAAGRQQGLQEGSGTRSSLAWDAIRLFSVKRPRLLLMENVAALIQSKFIRDFHKILSALEKIGYSNFTKVLNSKHYGIPQNRDRVFMVSILRDKDNPNTYNFPKSIPLKKCLADMLEDNVDDSYFLSDEMLARFCMKSLEEEGGGTVPDFPQEEEDGFDNIFVCQ